MTAAVLVMSSRAIAMAADSRAAIDNGESVEVVDTATKLFRISASQPIALLIDASQTFMGTPWEAIVAAYVKARGGVAKDTINEWALDFADFLQSLPVASDANEESIRKIVTEAVMSATEVPRMGIGETGEWEASDNFVGLTLDVLNGRAASLANCDQLHDGTSEKMMLLRYNIVISDAVKQAIGAWAPPAVMEAANHLARRAVMSQAMPHSFAKLAFAGFCNGNIVPSAVLCRCGSTVGDRLKFDFEGERLIPLEGKGVIAAFEEGSGIRSILYGYNSEFLRATQSCAHEIIVERLEAIAEEVRWKEKAFSKSLSEEAVPIADHVADNIEEAARKRALEDWFFPWIERVSRLSDSDLADFASGLVEHAIFQNRFSDDDASAGGPVDVAIMTPDSFKWVRQKNAQQFEIEVVS